MERLKLPCIGMILNNILKTVATQTEQPVCSQISTHQRRIVEPNDECSLKTI